MKVQRVHPRMAMDWNNTILQAKFIALYRNWTHRFRIANCCSTFTSISSHALKHSIATINVCTEAMLNRLVSSKQFVSRKILQNVHDGENQFCEHRIDCIFLFRGELGHFWVRESHHWWFPQWVGQVGLESWWAVLKSWLRPCTSIPQTMHQ